MIELLINNILFYLPLQDTSNITKVLKEKIEYRPKSYLADSVSVTTNVSDRLSKLTDASANWKNRVETKDAEKFTVAAKTNNQPAQLPFTKSEVRCCPPMIEYQCTNPSPLGLAKSPSMVVSTSVTNGKGLGLQLPAFSRSVSVSVVEEKTCTDVNNGGVKVVVPKLDEDKLFDKFFTSTQKRNHESFMKDNEDSKSDSANTSEWDLDAITSTQRWVDRKTNFVFVINLISYLFVCPQTDP